MENEKSPLTEHQASPHLMRFLNRLRILRSLDEAEVPDVTRWPQFRDDPYLYLISCLPAEAEHIWAALNKREEGDDGR